MTPRAKTVSIVAVLALLLVAGLWLLNRPQPAALKSPPTQAAGAAAPTPAVAEPASTIAAAPASTTSPAAVAQSQSVVVLPTQPVSAVQPFTLSAVPAPAAPSLSPLTLTPPSPESQAREEAATARMYAAHAPLRTPEVADPDSKANKQILGTMVAKALAQPATPPPTVP